MGSGIFGASPLSVELKFQFGGSVMIGRDLDGHLKLDFHELRIHQMETQAMEALYYNSIVAVVVASIRGES
ncbi:hypothetical protein [Cyanobium sp. ULC084]